MRSRPPIYKTHGRSYRIDTNRPQLRAIEERKIDFHALTHGHYPGKLLDGRSLPGLSTIGYWDAVGAQDWGLESHRNEGLEIHLLETGAMPFVVDGRRHDLRAGDLTITRPWQLHRLGDPSIGAGRLHWFVIDVGVRRPDQDWRWPRWISLVREDVDEVTTRLRQTDRPVWRSTPEIRRNFGAIADAIRRNEGHSHVSQVTVNLNALFLNLLVLLRRENAPPNPELASQRHTVELFLADLRSNPASQEHAWTLNEMAGQCGVGVTTFVKYCRQITNASPVKYLLRCRLDRAAQRLVKEPDTPITTIATDGNFSSSQHFSSQFRRFFGCSPRDYRIKGLRRR